MGKTFTEKLKERIENYPRLFNVIKTTYYLLFREKTADFDIVLYNVYELGIEQRGVNELLEYYENGNTAVKKDAAWHLAMWHANHFNTDDAKQALKYVSYFKEHEKNKRKLEVACYLEAECYYHMNRIERARTTIFEGVKRNSPEKFMALTQYTGDIDEKNHFLRQLYGIYNMESVTLSKNGFLLAQDKSRLNANDQSSDILVSILVPVFNCAPDIERSLYSLIHQTWKHIEVVVVDQGSTDATVHRVHALQTADSRIRLIDGADCRGFFDALNKGYRESQGELVTSMSADQWSHPQRIETQVRHLEGAPMTCVANMVKSVRSNEGFRLQRGKTPNTYLFTDLLSLMFRKKQLQPELGYWDSVREGGERELLARIRKMFGPSSAITLPDGPLIWKFFPSKVLASFKGFVKQNYLYDSAQRHYEENYTAFHAVGKSLYIEWPQEKNERKFPVPHVLLPEYEPHKPRHFDIIDVSDLRLPGGTTSSIGEELKAQKQEGLTTGLIQLPLYGFSKEKPLSPRIESQIDEEKVQWIGTEEEVSCNILVLRHPPVLQDEKRFVPKVKTDNVAVVINQAPRRDYGGPIEKTFIYDFTKCNTNLLRYFGTEGVWYPNGSVLRETLNEYHSEDINQLIFADKDWANIIDIEEWERSSRPVKGSKIRIGRHSRDHYVKWPKDAETMKLVYPESSRYEIRVLGGASSAKRVLSPLPKNWKVYEFGSMQPKDFLAGLDVFVYFHHPDWVEPFGRNIFEAMTVGVPVITAPHFKSLYKDAAIYARPEEVQEKIAVLMDDDQFYARQVSRARSFIIETFGYQKHIEQVNKNSSYYTRGN